MPSPYATMSSIDRPTLSVCVNAAAAPESACESPTESAGATVARNSRPACRRALTRLYSCTWYLSPPSRNDAPSMNSVLVTMAPAIDAFTSMYCPARKAVERDDQLRQVAQRGVQQPADRVAGLGGHRFGRVAEQRGQRHDRQHRQHEQQRVRVVRECSRREHRRHEDQQPQQLVVPNLCEEQSHLDCLSSARGLPSRPAIVGQKSHARAAVTALRQRVTTCRQRRTGTRSLRQPTVTMRGHGFADGRPG